MREYDKSETVLIPFNTEKNSDRSPITLVGGAVEVYKDEDTTQFSTGATLLVDYDSIVGSHFAKVVLSDVIYANSSVYTVKLSAGTVDGVSKAGAILGQFKVTPFTEKRVWDEVLTGATHNITSSAGKRLRNLASQVVWDGIAQGAGADNNQIQLDTGASSVDGAYDPSTIAIIGGTGAGQCRGILNYTGSTRMATVDRSWKVQPDATSEFVIYASAGREHVNEGLAQAGSNNTITLNANASSLNNNYVGQLVFIRSGTGEDQVRVVSTYNGTTKVATVTENWGTNPDVTSAYVMLPAHVHELTDIASAVRTELATELARIDAATSTRLASASYTAPDNATISTIATVVSSTGVTVSAASIAAVWDHALIGVKTARQIFKPLASALWGLVSGMGGTNPKFKSVDPATPDKIVIDATTDIFGNRSQVTVDDT